MIGGGPGSFIGAVHRQAAWLDGQVELVAGAFSRDPAKSKAQGEQLYLDPARVYGDYRKMAEIGAKKPASEKLDFVSITTTNESHRDVACAFLKAGFPVVCDKPLAFDAAQGRDMVKTAKKTGQPLFVTYNYSGYPMVKLARDFVKKGELGKIRKIVLHYPQGWLHVLAEADGTNKQAAWRTDPLQCGASGCMGDLGIHAQHLSEYITGKKIIEVCADLTIFVPGRKLEDDGNVLMRWEDDVKGLLYSSQISIGEENGLTIYVYGEKAGLEWHQEHPNYLYVKRPDAPVEIWRRGNSYVNAMSPAAARCTRTPFGHPEAYIEAFANIYGSIIENLRCRAAGETLTDAALDVNYAEDALRGVLWVGALVKSSNAGAIWTPVEWK